MLNVLGDVEQRRQHMPVVQPVRILHQDFIARYQLLAASQRSTKKRAHADAKQQISNMMQVLGATDTLFRVGVSKVFMKRALHDRLEEDRSSLLVRDAMNIQRVCRGHLARNYVRLLRQVRLDAALIMQRSSRMARARLLAATRRR